MFNDDNALAPEPSEAKEFFDDIPTEGDLSAEKDAPAQPSGSSPEQKTEEPKPRDRGFADHPRWKAREAKMREQETRIKAYDDRIAKLEENIRKSSETLPEWFTTRFGNDPKTWEAYQATSRNEWSQRKQEILDDIKAESRREADKQAEMEGWVEENLQALTDDGETFDRNRLLRILNDYAPTDAQGNIDFRKGLALLREIDSAKAQEQKDKSAARRGIAAATVSSGKGEKPKGALSVKSLRRMSFHDLVQ